MNWGCDKHKSFFNFAVCRQCYDELEAKNERLREALTNILGWRENDYEGNRAKFAIEHMEKIARKALEE